LKVAILTVFYPDMLQYQDEYFECVARQTYPDSKLVIVNDEYPLDLKVEARKYDLGPSLIPSAGHPQLNRLAGLEYCYDEKFDIVILSDSDETMYPDRVQRVVDYFASNPEAPLVYNNSYARSADYEFNLYYKDQLRLTDILDFNMLGYGAMNLRRNHIPFILEHQNLNVYVFDWWLALIYLLHNREVDFLKDAKNQYRAHDKNHVGPLLRIEEDRLRLGIKTKQLIYGEMIEYCNQRDLNKEAELFRNRLREVRAIAHYVSENSIEFYAERVKDYFREADNMYWWQDVVTMNQLEIGNQI